MDENVAKFSEKMKVKAAGKEVEEVREEEKQ